MINFVTTLTEDYAPGLVALLQSMRENATCDYGFTVVCYEPVSDEVIASVEAFGISVTWFDVADLGEFPAPRSLTQRMVPNFNKPLVWRLPLEKAIYIDTDVLCLGSLAEMADWEELTVVQLQSSIQSVREVGTGRGRHLEINWQRLNENPAYLRSGMTPWNAGIYGFRPSEETLQGIMKQARSYDRPVQFGDQVIQNDFFNRERPEVIKYAEMKWNMSTWVSKKFPLLFESTDTRLLHFAHDAKPWRDEPEHAWQVKLWDLWNGFYERAMECNKCEQVTIAKG